MLFQLSILGLAHAECTRYTVRKEVNDMTAQDWQVYSSTIQQAVTRFLPSGKSVWEEAVMMHVQLFDQVHGGCSFFPWHRYFLAHVESELQQINPEFQFPYWNEHLDHASVETTTMWNHLGTSGTPVRDGSFAGLVVARQPGIYSNLHRDFTLQRLDNVMPGVEIFAQMFVESLSRKESAPGYSKWWEIAYLNHGYLHAEMHGFMNTSMSPFDPMFYVHHAFYDHLYDQAQQGWKAKGLDMNALYDAERGCRPDVVLPGFTKTYRQVLDSKNDLCVIYALRGETVKLPESQVQPTPSVSRTFNADPLPTGSHVSRSGEVTPSGYPAPHRTLLGSDKSRSAAPLPTNDRGYHYPSKSRSSSRSMASSASADATGRYAIPTDGPNPPAPYKGYDGDYKPMNRCPPPLPEAWKALGGMLEMANEIERRAQKQCQKALEQKQDEQVKMPYFSSQDRVDLHAQSIPSAPSAPKDQVSYRNNATETSDECNLDDSSGQQQPLLSMALPKQLHALSVLACAISLLVF